MEYLLVGIAHWLGVFVGILHEKYKCKHKRKYPMYEKYYCPDCEKIINEYNDIYN